MVQNRQQSVSLLYHANGTEGRQLVSGENPDRFAEYLTMVDFGRLSQEAFISTVFSTKKRVKGRIESIEQSCGQLK